MNQNEYSECTLCPRKCRVNRETSVGYCQMPDHMLVSRASLHMWEEPILSGNAGSGTIFFSGCSLRCAYCQNATISRGQYGKEVRPSQLADLCFMLKEKGAHNINLVTPTHFRPSIVEGIRMAKERGLNLPIVYNTSGYETVESIESLQGIVDIYLTDMKYSSKELAKKYSYATDYPDVSRKAFLAMLKQVGDAVLDENGRMKKGIIARILLLPGYVIDAKQTLLWLSKQKPQNFYYSLMRQYTPCNGCEAPLDRRVTDYEYHSFVSYAESLGITKAFLQEKGCAEDSFIPPFDESGLENI